MQYMNILMPWNQDSSLNKQLVKLFSFSPYCVTLDHSCFRLALYSSDFQSVLVGGEICNNDDGSLFLKLFKQSERITTLTLLQYPFFTRLEPLLHYLYFYSYSFYSVKVELSQRFFTIFLDYFCSCNSHFYSFGTCVTFFSTFCASPFFIFISTFFFGVSSIYSTMYD